MNYNRQYEILAAQLGDTEYKLLVLKAQKKQLIEAIRQLNDLAGQNPPEGQNGQET